MPFLVLNIIARCNSRCLMCDFWKNRNGDELSAREIQSVADSVKRLNIKKFVISGGEPLLHPDFTTIVNVLEKTKAKLSLATNGIMLEEYASLVAGSFSTVFVSLDGGDPETYKKVRGVDGLADVMAGVKKLKSLNPSILVIGRNIIQKSNYLDLPAIVKTAKDMGMDHISFSAADINYAAFGRDNKVEREAARNILLDENDLIRFKAVITGLKKAGPEFFSSRFIIEGFKVFLNIHSHYEAMAGKSDFPAVRCNLPWLYAVIDADGNLRPCCLHKGIGNIRQESFEKIVASAMMTEFRKKLKKQKNSMCSCCAYSSAKVHLKMLYEMF
jgi:MoaA/NifB/PqqE/SkfB family radical SAM enzyme